MSLSLGCLAVRIPLNLLAPRKHLKLNTRLLQVAKDRSKEGLKKAVQEKGPKRWRKHEIRIIENSLLTFGRLTKPEAQMAAWSKVRSHFRILFMLARGDNVLEGEENSARATLKHFSLLVLALDLQQSQNSRTLLAAPIWHLCEKHGHKYGD